MSEIVRASRSLSLSGARRVLDGSLMHAEHMAVPVCVAVTDNAGHLLAYMRMDDAPLLSAQIAQNKAYSVVAFNGLPTHAWWDAIADDPSLRNGIVHTDRLVIFGGGVPVLQGGNVVGAIGVSGGSAEQDCAIAEAGAAAID
ncbi:heme-binding protein [Mycolicibacterium sp.]|uniref:heme-binding protein n=1 Tax=Mycolicibacterium sp. TaxID=2320850 RepID=UPI0037C7DDCA